MKYTFDSKIGLYGSLPWAKQEVIKAEPQVFGADYGFALAHGGDLTRQFLSELPAGVLLREDFILDTRVHMLMPGIYPCIPGWHHDDVPRRFRADDQPGEPNYDDPEYHANHAMVFVGDASATEFLIGRVTLEYDRFHPNGKSTYGKWHHDIEELRVAQNYAERQWGIKPTIKFQKIEPGRVVEFDWQSFHQGTPATKHGWRFFARASWNTHRKHENQIRTQTQVYMADPFKGW